MEAHELEAWIGLNTCLNYSLQSSATAEWCFSDEQVFQIGLLWSDKIEGDFGNKVYVYTRRQFVV